MASLVQREIEPVLVREQVAIEAVPVVRVASFRRGGLEVLLVFLAVLLLDFLVVEDLRALSPRTKANQKALEGDGPCGPNHVGVKLGHSHLDKVERLLRL